MPQHETPIKVGYYRPRRFVQIPKWVMALLPSRTISQGAALAYAALAGYADNDTGQARPGMAKIGADIGGRSADVARRAVAELEKVGAVKVYERPIAGARNLPNLYLLAGDEPIPEADRHRDTLPPDALADVVSNPADVPAWAVENSPAVAVAPSPAVDKGEGGKFATQGEGGKFAGDLPGKFARGTRTKKELEPKSKEMSDGDAARTVDDGPGPVDKPAAPGAAPGVAADFEAWWTAFRDATNAPTGPKKTAAAAYASARRSGATAEELRDGLAAFGSGLARDYRGKPFVPNWPHAVTWLRAGRWTEYPPSGPQSLADALSGSRMGSEASRAVEAVRGPFTPPELPAELSPGEYQSRVAADRADWLAGSGRWEGVTA